jgi:hypothetical protein
LYISVSIHLYQNSGVIDYFLITFIQWNLAYMPIRHWVSIHTYQALSQHTCLSGIESAYIPIRHWVSIHTYQALSQHTYLSGIESQNHCWW